MTTEINMYSKWKHKDDVKVYTVLYPSAIVKTAKGWEEAIVYKGSGDLIFIRTQENFLERFHEVTDNA